MDFDQAPPHYHRIAPAQGRDKPADFEDPLLRWARGKSPLQQRQILPTNPRMQFRCPAGHEKKVMSFETIRKIGKGGEGEAWLVRSVADNSLVVRKVLRSWKKDGDRPFEAKILNEILPAHPNVLSLYYYSLRPEENKLHMYYEYCSGGSLQNLISNGKPGSLPESFIWHVFIQLAEALEVLHYRGTQRVVHRDVKPDNVFLGIPYSSKQTKNSYPSVRLGDFGLATLSSVTSGAGTWMWMGPEVPEASAKGDMWSLGATIHALAHGKGPIDMSGHNWEKDPRARRLQKLPSKYSDQLNKSMMRCLQRDPNDRVSSRDLVKKLKRDRSD